MDPYPVAMAIAAAYFIAVDTLVNRVLTLDPRLTTEAAMATPTPDAIIAYSIAVAPVSSRTKRRTGVKIVSLVNLNIGSAFRHLAFGSKECRKM
jgi:hypothetical protein